MGLERTVLKKTDRLSGLLAAWKKSPRWPMPLVTEQVPEREMELRLVLALVAALKQALALVQAELRGRASPVLALPTPPGLVL